MTEEGEPRGVYCANHVMRTEDDILLIACELHAWRFTYTYIRVARSLSTCRRTVLFRMACRQAGTSYETTCLETHDQRAVLIEREVRPVRHLLGRRVIHAAVHRRRPGNADDDDVQLRA